MPKESRLKTHFHDKLSWLKLLTEIIAIYSENHVKHKYTLLGKCSYRLIRQVV
jgi:hypothetical protein